MDNNLNALEKLAKNIKNQFAEAGKGLTQWLSLSSGLSAVITWLKKMPQDVHAIDTAMTNLYKVTDATADSVRKVQNQILKLTHGRVNIFDGAGNVRDYYDIMTDISNVYDRLSGTDKADLSELLFGKQRETQGTAFIEAFQSGQIQSAYEAALNSQGFAMQEQERWMDSLDAKLQQFEASFQSLSKNVLDSDLLKFFVDLGTSAVSAFDNISSKLGSLKTLLLGAGLFAGLKNVGMAKS